VPDLREPTPPYLRIARIIQEQIEHGELLPGEQVPSMARLCETYGISRGTARRVLTTLRDWGLVEITPGWGTFVRQPGGPPRADS
jgi:GntR family transcriptional regulator